MISVPVPPDVSFPRNSERRRTVLVVGLGVSGRAACSLALRRGFRVLGADTGGSEMLQRALKPLMGQGVVFRLGKHRLEDFLEADLIVVSPGVPLDLEPLEIARRRGIEIIGEMEWAWRHLRLPTVAVTGTNGKTTTTELIGAMFQAAGREVFVGGNLGTPLSQWLLERLKRNASGEVEDAASGEWCVLEVSSFQLDSAPTFCPDIGVVLNVTPDHLDRYPDFEAYASSKFSLFKEPGERRQRAVLNKDDPVCRRRAASLRLPVHFFSLRDPEADAVVQDRKLRVRIPGRTETRFSLDRWSLSGVHNLENLMAAVLTSLLCGIDPGAVQEVIETFRPSPHRMEDLGRIAGIRFINDSKGTNPGAVAKALESCPSPVVLLMGGQAKKTAFRSLGPLCAAKVKRLIIFGDAAGRIEEELGKWVPCETVPDLEEAFAEAVKQAGPGDTVLLSPGCASFDQYSDYAQRGDHFRRLVDRFRERETKKGRRFA